MAQFWYDPGDTYVVFFYLSFAYHFFLLCYGPFAFVILVVLLSFITMGRRKALTMSDLLKELRRA